MSGNKSYGLPSVPAFERPSNLELSNFDKDTIFPYPAAATTPFFMSSEELSHYFGQTMSLDPTRPPMSGPSSGRGSSVTTSPSASTPGEVPMFNAFDWSSASESNSPKSSTVYGTSQLHDYDFSPFGANMLPESPPSDVFTPSLVRRPPLSQTRNQKVKYNFCVFCKNNGEDESYYLSHTLKDDNGRVTCPILYKYKCPICHSTGPVSHTIRYCPHNKDHHIYEEKAHITVLKQMRSSTGSRRAPAGIIGGPSLHSVPPSRRPQPEHVGPLPLSRRPQSSHGSRPIISTNCMRGPNAAHTGMTNQPCMVPGPMYGELLNQEDRERRERERANANAAAYEELSNFACNYKN